ncbi:uncharacterized protein LOC106083314 [Stomoxys calcitrans]|uniref:uncharacterized protein LOC106083314 n=1 Tax=Stomoxys calcitrans TaxID=35570 RepID=UPI0027E35382|nr:uncharacterized protein LOC106083314 [Stomoxys calcitrans]XP_059217511.1 uncharacterized protein LOC106083314 [Stomoxys calcitrans]
MAKKIASHFNNVGIPDNMNYAMFVMVKIFCIAGLCASAILWLSIDLVNAAGSKYKFTNIKCQDHDKSFSHFEQCQLKVVKRGVVTLNVRVDLYKSPVTNSTMNVTILKKSNGYRAIIPNTTIDVCEYFKNTKRFPIIRMIFAIFEEASNLNHTCPYYDSIIIKDLLLEEKNFVMFPFPPGDYQYLANIYAYNDLKATIQVFSTKSV